MTPPPTSAPIDQFQSLLSELQERFADMPDKSQEAVMTGLSRLIQSLGDPVAMPDERAPSTSSPRVSWLAWCLQQSHMGAWYWDAATQEMYWSEEMYELYGADHSQASIPPTDFDRMIHPEDQDQLRDLQRIMQAMYVPDPAQGDEHFSHEFRVLRRDGKMVWVNSAGGVERDASGRVIRVGGLARDVTDRKRTEEALLESQRREQQRASELQAIMDAVPAMLWIARDPRCEQMVGNRYGYEFLEMWEGANISKTAPEEELNLQPYRNFKDGREIPGDELPMQMAAATGKGVEKYEFDLVFGDGKIKTVLGNAVALLDRDGKPAGAVSAFMDITEQKQMREVLARREAELREAQRLAHIGSWYWDRGTDFLSGSEEMLRILGLSHKTQPRLSDLLERLDPPESKEALLAAIRQTLETGLPHEIDTEIHQSGTTLWVTAQGEAVRDTEGKIVALRGTLQDITERKQAEEALRRQNALLAAVNRIFNEAMRAESDETVGLVCLQVAEEITGSKFAFVGEINPRTGRLDDIAISESAWAAGRSPEAPSFKGVPSSIYRSRIIPGGFEIHGIYGRVLKDGQAFFTNDPQSHPDRIGTPAGHQPLTAFLGVPLFYRGRLFGMIGLANREGGYTPETQQAVEALAPAIVQAIQTKRAEKALRQSEEQFHTSIENLPEGFVLFSALREEGQDGNPGRIVDLRYDYVNEAACRLMARDRNEIMGHTLLELFAGSFENRMFERYAGVIETGHPLVEQVFVYDDQVGSPQQFTRVFDIRAAKVGDGLVRTRNDITERVRLENERQEAISRMEIQERLKAQSEADRQSIARDIHDGPVQTLAAIAINLQMTKEAFPDPALRVELDQIGLDVKSASQELRQVINELRPPLVLQHGLAEAIMLHAEEVRGRSPDTRWEYAIEEDGQLLPEALRLTLFRIYQEATSNVIRHAGASRALVRFTRDGGKVILEVRDNGRGLPEKYDPETLVRHNHYGLAGMAERADVIGGELEITSAPGAGTFIKVTVPLAKKEGAGTTAPQ